MSVTAPWSRHSRGRRRDEDFHLFLHNVFKIRGLHLEPYVPGRTCENCRIRLVCLVIALALKKRQSDEGGTLEGLAFGSLLP